MKKALVWVAVLALVGVQVNAAVITWGTANNMAGADATGDVDVSWGVLVSALNVNGASDVSLNGVAFETEANNTSITVPGNPHTDFVFDPTTPAITSTDYLNSLDYARYGVSQIQVTGLNIGTDYRIQVWANDARGSSYVALGRSTFLNAGDGTNPTNGVGNVQLAENQNVGGTSTLGQWVIGSFTADSDTETIFVSGYDGNEYKTEFAVVPLVQVRAIPEPAALGLIASVAAGMIFIRRRFMI